jgi:hypothetical protein
VKIIGEPGKLHMLPPARAKIRLFGVGRSRLLLIPATASPTLPLAFLSTSPTR